MPSSGGYHPLSVTQHRLAQTLPIDAPPEAALAAWPATEPLAVLWSDPRSPSPQSRWTLLARPTGAIRAVLAAAPDGHSTVQARWVGPSRERPPRLKLGADPMSCIASAAASTAYADPCPHDLPPFLGGWIGGLSYQLGAIIEPAATGASRRDESTEPVMLWQRCPAAYAHDNLHRRWWVVGDPAAREALPPITTRPVNAASGFWCSPVRITRPPETYHAAVRRAVEYIRAGDIFQANIAHTLSSMFEGSARALFAALVQQAAPWYGAYLEDAAPQPESPRRAICSISPELFLEFDSATRRVATRPIKGTRRAGRGAAAALAESAKDTAELAMIVDLMRNDLGRVCEFGSMRVSTPRAFETHGAAPAQVRAGASEDHDPRGGVVHAVATVEGRLRHAATVADLLRATFPGGSITGAPKIRAMQIIDELEVSRRGFYTGSIGYVSDCGRAAFNIAIRTAEVVGRAPRAGCAALDLIDRAELTYRVGAGIVADSEPAAEWDETLAKAGVIFNLTAGHIVSAASIGESVTSALLADRA